VGRGNLDLLSCWWVVSQVLEGFFDEFWDWWWLRKVLEGEIRLVSRLDVERSVDLHHQLVGNRFRQRCR
jgi:hypothetical protein